MDLISLSEEDFYNMLSHMSNEKYGVETYRYRVESPMVPPVREIFVLDSMEVYHDVKRPV